MRKVLMFLLPLSLTPLVMADTIHLKTGVIVEGETKELADGIISVTSGENTVFYAADEVQQIEENDRTGVLSTEEIEAQLAAEDAVIMEQTGLTREQRQQVLDLLYKLQRSEVSEHVPVRDKLIALQKQFDVYRFLVFMLPELSHRLTPNTLEVLFHIDASKTVPLLLEYLNDRYAGTRARAIDLLGETGAAGNIPGVARGLADHAYEVKLAAIYSLAKLNARQSTPALIELLGGQEPRLSNASRKALETLWANRIADKAPQTSQEWMALWRQQESVVGQSIQLASLVPLIQPEQEFQNE